MFHRVCALALFNSALLRNWIYRIAINAALDVLRQPKTPLVDLERFRCQTCRRPKPFLEKERALIIQQHRVADRSNRSVLTLRIWRAFV
jgi:DNA-directed RNA polymerase specialized sigma24 family protein